MTSFQRRGPRGFEQPVVVISGVVYDLRPLTADIDEPFLGSDGLVRARAAALAGELPERRDLADARIGAPIAKPSAVICVGQNYAAHAAESGSPTPTAPIIFFKHPNTVVGPHDDIPFPPDATQLDWEVELGIVIGSRAHRTAGPADALAHVAGYVVSHDVSERRWQLELSGGQWSKGKTDESFNPLGPDLVPADEIDPQALRLWSTVNGEPRQDSNTVDMVFSVAELVHDLSQFCALDPGDLINTGTPQGVAVSGRFAYLAVGDVVDLGIDGLGQQRSVITASGGAQ